MAVGRYRHLVRVQHPGPPVPNGDGGYTATPLWVDATPPTWFCGIVEGTGDQERPAAGSTIASGTHLLRGHYRGDITVRSRIIVKDTQVFAVVGVTDPGLLGVELVLACVAVDETAVPPPPLPMPEGSFSQDGFSQPGFDQTYGESS